MIIPFLVCCKKTDNELIETTNTQECIFEEKPENMDGLIDNTEKTLMNECIEQALTTRQGIQENLIGEWKLIGFAAGSCCANSTMPCGYITVMENELTFEYRYFDTDTITTHTWEVQEINNRNTVTISPYSHKLNFTTICPQYLFGDGTPVDANMFLYQKVN